MSLYAGLRAPAARLLLKGTGSSMTVQRFAIAGTRVAGMRLVAQHSRRLASSAASLATADLLPSDSLQEPIEAVEAADADTAVKFDTIKDHVHKNTYDALTNGPFNFVNMTSVQASVLSLLPELAQPATEDKLGAPKDLLVKAKTGTGKTVAFLVPAIEAWNNDLQNAAKQSQATSGLTGREFGSSSEAGFAKKNVGTLIISPTRELAIQIGKEAAKLTKYHRHAVHCFVGGESLERQMKEFRMYRKDIVVATPGRLKDILENRPEVLQNFANLRTLVLDEADTLLDMGFRSDIETIINSLPKEAMPQRHTYMFSATVSPAIRNIARAALNKNHAFIDCISEDDSPVHANIPQYVSTVSPGDHIKHLVRLVAQDQLQSPGTSKIMVFCATKKMTVLAAAALRATKGNLPNDETEIIELHSGVTQEGRRKRAEIFRNSKSASILVTSDVSARGVDYPNVSRVIQLGAPSSTEQYIHRVGRTGRGDNAKGRGDLILLPMEKNFAKYCLTEVPIKSSNISEIEQEVFALAKEYDQDPSSYLAKSGASVPTPSLPPRGHGRYYRQAPPLGTEVSPRLEALNSELDNFLHKGVDPELSREAFMSMLGHYISLGDDLRVSKSDLLDGIRTWYAEAFNSEPPHISENMLQKLGLNSDGGSRRRGGGGGMFSRGGRGGDRDMRRDGDRRSSFSRGSNDRGGYGRSRENSDDDLPPRQKAEWGSGRGGGYRSGGGGGSRWQGGGGSRTSRDRF